MTLATDWVTISALATAAGTLVLAIATFASVRSANRAARTAELTLLAGLRPLLLPSRLEDPTQKVTFVVSAAAGSGRIFTAMFVGCWVIVGGVKSVRRALLLSVERT